MRHGHGGKLGKNGNKFFKLAHFAAVCILSLAQRHEKMARVYVVYHFIKCIILLLLLLNYD